MIYYPDEKAQFVVDKPHRKLALISLFSLIDFCVSQLKLNWVLRFFLIFFRISRAKNCSQNRLISNVYFSKCTYLENCPIYE